MTLLLAFALGIVAGQRSMTAPAAVAWAAHFDWLHLESTPLAFLDSGAALAGGLGQLLLAGALAGALGAVAGTRGGYQARTGLVRALAVPDYVVALAEDVAAVGGAILIVAVGAERRLESLKHCHGRDVLKVGWTYGAADSSPAGLSVLRCCTGITLPSIETAAGIGRTPRPRAHPRG